MCRARIDENVALLSVKKLIQATVGCQKLDGVKKVQLRLSFNCTLETRRKYTESSGVYVSLSDLVILI